MHHLAGLVLHRTTPLRYSIQATCLHQDFCLGLQLFGKHIVLEVQHTAGALEMAHTT